MRKFVVFGVTVAAMMMAGCGGGGDSSPTSSATTSTNTSTTTTPPTTTPPVAGSAEGLWTGITNLNRSLTGLVLSDGSYYVLYSGINNPNSIAGVVQGTGTSNSGVFTSSNAKDFNLEGLGVTSATISATYTTKSSFGGTISYSPSGSSTFQSSYDADYDVKPSLASLAGTYAVVSGSQSITVMVSSSGAISGNDRGCTFSGTATPRTDSNTYNISVTFGASVCALPGQTVNGIAYYRSSTKNLYAVALNSARTNGIIFAGPKL